MTRKPKTAAQVEMPGIAPAPLPAPLKPPTSPAIRQLLYRERMADRHNRNAQIANEAMGIVNRVRACWDLGIDFRGVTRDADEVTTLREVGYLLSLLADPFGDAEKLVQYRNATVTPTKGRAKPVAKRARIAK